MVIAQPGLEAKNPEEDDLQSCFNNLDHLLAAGRQKEEQ